MLTPRIIAALAFSIAQTTPAISGEWFKHEFGELRAYHGDWLNVCADNGKGACRAVQVQKKKNGDRFFGQARLSIHVSVGGSYIIDVYKQGMPALPRIVPITTSIDSAPGGKKTLSGIEFRSRSWRPGEATAENVAESFTLTDTKLNTLLVQQMLPGRSLRFKYALDTNGNLDTVTFSLRGVTAALNAIDKHYKNREIQ